MRDGETIFSLTLIHSQSAAPKSSFAKLFSVSQAEGINVRVRKMMDFFSPPSIANADQPDTALENHTSLGLWFLLSQSSLNQILL